MENINLLKIATVVGTRPELIRLSRVINALDKHLNLVLIHTGQNYDYELNKIFFDDLEIREPDYFLNSTEGSTSAAHTIGNILISIDKFFESNHIDALLVLGDTNSCLAVIPAKKRKIPIFHMEAGNRCFDMRVPEEINRKIVDHIADVNLTYSAISREYLIREGIDPQFIIKTGSPMKEVINFYLSNIIESNILSRLKLQKYKYMLISFHREENLDNDLNFDKFVNLIDFLATKYNYPLIISTHPRTRKKINEKKIKFPDLVSLIKPLGYFDYVNLEINSKFVLSDSGTITEESSILNFPALNLRDSNERPEGFEEAAVMMSGLNISDVSNALNILESQPRNSQRILKMIDDYNVDNVSEKIVRIISSYTHKINRDIWKKNN
jgi:UDP-N-acetylglucosamine 2-epimerase (non-hydrolysing)